MSREGRPTGRWCDALPVWWGERLYLLGAADLARFCNGINWGDEPRSRMYLRTETTMVRDLRMDCSVDEPPGDGGPLLPPEIAGWILRKPVEAWAVSKFPDGSWQLDRGASEGIYPGMRLRLFGREEAEAFVTVHEVSAHSCITDVPESRCPEIVPRTHFWCNAKGARFATSSE
ncbi:MAG: hypothetical protein HYY18_02905 [Planctomycetes bacterium]|nr:hypothetical protein [Planctomycetota bacterium]